MAIENSFDRLRKRINKFFLFGRYAGVPFREYLTYEEIKNGKWKRRIKGFSSITSKWLQ